MHGGFALTKMRRGCPFCVRKHLAQATILLTESIKGYPHHLWLAVGHLAEAEDECEELYPQFAKKIREIRLEIMHGDNRIILEELLMDFLKITGELKDGDYNKGNSKHFYKKFEVKKK